MKTHESIIRIADVEDLPLPSFLEEPQLSPDMKLSKHFCLKEFVRSATALKNGLDNMPGMDEVERLRQLCIHVLEPLRERFGAIRITSGYRSYRVNDLVGGSRTSQHMYGEAADIHVGNTEVGKKMYDFIHETLDFDQLLIEVKGKQSKVVHCLHVSYRSDRGPNRRYSRMQYELK